MYKFSFLCFLFIFLSFVSRISIDKFSWHMFFLFLLWQHLLIGKVPTCLMALMFSFSLFSYIFYWSFNSIGRIYVSLHLHREVHICKVSDVAFALYFFNIGYFFSHLVTKVINYSYPNKDSISLFSKAKRSLSSSADCGLSLCETQFCICRLRKLSLKTLG